MCQKFLHLAAALLIMTTVSSHALTVVPLWDGPAPKSNGTAPNDTPTLTVFLPTGATKPTSVIVICPGGGYSHLAFDFEGETVAAYFQSKGVAACVLKYRLPGNGYRHPVPMLDGQRAIRVVRSRATEWNIDPAKVGIMGFSAGGHLASTVETHFDEGDPNAANAADKLSCRPDFAVLVYPVITFKGKAAHQGSMANLLGPIPDPALIESLSNETQVTAKTPPTLLIQSTDDASVPIENSRLMLAALQKAGVTSALQEYPHAPHGFGYGRTPDKSPAGWLDKAYDWLKAQALVP